MQYVEFEFGKVSHIVEDKRRTRCDASILDVDNTKREPKLPVCGPCRNADPRPRRDRDDKR